MSLVNKTPPPPPRPQAINNDRSLRASHLKLGGFRVQFSPGAGNFFLIFLVLDFSIFKKKKILEETLTNSYQRAWVIHMNLNTVRFRKLYDSGLNECPLPSLGLTSEQIIAAPSHFLRFKGYNKENILSFLALFEDRNRLWLQRDQ